MMRSVSGGARGVGEGRSAHAGGADKEMTAVVCADDADAYAADVEMATRAGSDATEEGLLMPGAMQALEFTDVRTQVSKVALTGLTPGLAPPSLSGVPHPPDTAPATRPPAGRANHPA